ncbi:hypothetical protein ECP_3825 [Escherichia coli 536]|uniref:Uncharacterized protein n=1 Tax=Escherichia coli O6:K15:H31 (strain 536 / UPEC) TaxID=362663 RepID=A0A454A996_ECOL5|nr:hypothetical protein ECP_3825 [Escherichia coli 536]
MAYLFPVSSDSIIRLSICCLTRQKMALFAAVEMECRLFFIYCLCYVIAYKRVLFGICNLLRRQTAEWLMQ